MIGNVVSKELAPTSLMVYQLLIDYVALVVVPSYWNGHPWHGRRCAEHHTAFTVGDAREVSGKLHIILTLWYVRNALASLLCCWLHSRSETALHGDEERSNVLMRLRIWMICYIIALVS